MKKALIVLSVLILLLAGLFFWKGGHHAIYLSGVMEKWLDADAADQTLTIQIQQPSQASNHLTVTADSFWTDYADDRVFGLTAEGITAYISGKNLYFDTGKAYALPEMPELKHTLNRLSLGMLLYGRVTKSGDTYHIYMKTKELDLTASIIVDQTIQALTVKATLPDKTVLHTTISSKQTVPHPIPDSVMEAMDRAQTEQPMILTEPLEVLLPAAEGLLPLSGDLKLSISCGILELSESMQLNIQKEKAVLDQKGQTLEIPVDLSGLSPVAIAALLLREGEFTQSDDGAQFTIILSSDTATALLEALAPQAADLGITLGNSTLCLWITGERPTSARLTAKGSVPFLFTSIPVDFSAKLTIS